MQRTSLRSPLTPTVRRARVLWHSTMTVLTSLRRAPRLIAAPAALCIAAALRLLVPASSLAAAVVTPRPTMSDQNEDPVTDRVGPIDYLRADGTSRVFIGLAFNAQVFVLSRSHPEFSQYLALLRDAQDRGRPVRLTIRSHSGRVLAIRLEAPPAPAPARTPSSQ